METHKQIKAIQTNTQNTNLLSAGAKPLSRPGAGNVETICMLYTVSQKKCRLLNLLQVEETSVLFSDEDIYRP